MSDNNTKLIQEALDGYELHGSSDNAAVSQGWITAAHLAHALDAANGKIQQIKGALADYLMDDEADEVDALRGISNILTDA